MGGANKRVGVTVGMWGKEGVQSTPGNSTGHEKDRKRCKTNFQQKSPEPTTAKKQNPLHV